MAAGRQKKNLKQASAKQSRAKGQREAKAFWTPNKIRLAWAVILLVFISFRWTLIRIPLERDEGEYAYIAQQALQGDVPYRDAFDQKPPGVFFIYTIGMFIFGRSAEGIHFFLYVWTLVTVWLLYRLVSRFCGTGAGLLAALALSIMTAEKGVLGSSANTEVFMLLPIVASLLCLAPKEGRPKLRRIVAAGALVASACWIKQVAATNAAFLALWLVVIHFKEMPRRNLGRLGLDAICFLTGGLLATVPIFLYFQLTGAMKDFIYCVFTYNFSYAATELSTPGIVWKRFHESFGNILLGDWPLWLALGFALIRLTISRSWKLLGFLGGFLAASCIGVCFSGYFRPHYFMQMLPAVAALSGFGLACLIGFARERKTQVAVCLLVAIVVVAAPISANRNILFAVSPEAASLELYGPTPFVFSADLGKEIETLTKPGETVLVAGTEPQIAFFARRKSATRYIFFNPLAAQYKGVLENQKHAMEEIRKAKPACIVNLLGIYGNTIFNQQSEPYLLRELNQYIQDQEFQPVDYWIAISAEAIPKCYQRFTPGQIADYEKQSNRHIPKEYFTCVLCRPRK
jgi:hypothetical protein